MDESYIYIGDATLPFYVKDDMVDLFKECCCCGDMMSPNELVNVLRDNKWVTFKTTTSSQGMLFNIACPREYPRKWISMRPGDVRMHAAREGQSLRELGDSIPKKRDDIVLWLDANVSSSDIIDISFRGFNILNNRRHAPHLTQDRTSVAFVVQRSPSYAIMINQERSRNAIGPSSVIVPYQEDEEYGTLLLRLADYLSEFAEQRIRPEHVTITSGQWANPRDMQLDDGSESRIIYHGWFGVTRDCPASKIKRIWYEPGIRPVDVLDIVEERTTALAESRYNSLITSDTVVLGYIGSTTKLIKFVIDRIDKRNQIHIQQYMAPGVGIYDMLKFIPSLGDWHRIETSWGSQYSIQPFLMKRVGINLQTHSWGQLISFVSDSVPPHTRVEKTRVPDEDLHEDWLYEYQKDTVKSMMAHESMQDGTTSLFATRINGLPFQEGVFRIGNTSLSVYVPINKTACLRQTYGILADEPGMGKTRQVIALIKATQVEGEDRQTLVVVPPAVILQWKTEVDSVWPGNNVYVHHGRTRRDSIEEVTEPIILSTYNMVSHNPDTFSQKRWYRVVLDESHTINPAIYRTNVLQAQHKWCVTATPEIHLKHQMMWLTRGHDWQLLTDDGSVVDRNVSWNRIVQQDMTFMFMWKMFRPIMFRKTMDTHFTFPDVKEQTVVVRHSQQEGSLYRSEVTKVCQMNQYYASMPQSIGVGPRCTMWYHHLESICNGIDSNIDFDHSVCDIVNPSRKISMGRDDDDDDVCPICISSFEKPVMTACNHFFCLECLNMAYGRDQRCPYCRTPVKPKSCYLVDMGTDEPEEEHSRKRQRTGNNDEPDTKLARVLGDVTRVLGANQRSKILIFFNSPGLLKKYQDILSREISTTRVLSVHGMMNIKRRNENISVFQKEDDECRVLLLTVKCASAGINLTRADHVFLTTPVAPKSLEDQMIGRSKRIGQRSDEIHFVRYVYDNTVESSLLKDSEHGCHMRIIRSL